MKTTTATNVNQSNDALQFQSKSEQKAIATNVSQQDSGGPLCPKTNRGNRFGPSGFMTWHWVGTPTL